MLVMIQPFDCEAIEMGDTVTIRGSEGVTDRCVFIEGHVGLGVSRD
jgi:hypothetical protein